MATSSIYRPTILQQKKCVIGYDGMVPRESTIILADQRSQNAMEKNIHAVLLL